MVFDGWHIDQPAPPEAASPRPERKSMYIVEHLPPSCRGLPLIIGSSNYVSPKATLNAIAPAFLYLAFWYALAATAFVFLAVETKGRTIDEIDATLVKAPAAE
jgi:hypothetical protein